MRIPPRSGPTGDRRVAVSVVNWNTCDLTVNCLRALLSSTCATELEVVVVDNASTDGSAERIEAEFPGVTVVRNASNEGFARAHNQAFARTTAPYVLLLNSDAEVRLDTVAFCRDYLADRPDVGAVGCCVVRPDGAPQNSIFRFPSLRGVVSTSLWLVNAFPKSEVFNHDRYGSACPRGVTAVDVVMGSFLMVRRARIVGDLFDDGFFMYAEEADLCRRLRDSGAAVEYLPQVSVMHVEGGSTRTPHQVAWSHKAKKWSQLRYLKKWHGTPAAYAANVAMTVGMVPRIAGWLAADGFDRCRGADRGRRYKAGALALHVRCLIQPSYMSRRFTGPPVDGLARAGAAGGVTSGRCP